jgi:SAM-dependent methyltransferase
MLGDPWLENLEEIAAREDRSLSNTCVRLLKQAYLDEPTQSSHSEWPSARANAIGLTFQDSKRLPHFGWFPYVEGFSAPYVNEVLTRYGVRRAVYDPFGGSGTTQLAASLMGVPSWYSEVNPFMRFVAETKVASARIARDDLRGSQELLNQFISRIDTELAIRADGVDLSNYEAAFPGRGFFEERDIRELLAALDLASEIAVHNEAVHNLLRLAVSANAVHSSNMTRRADLRRRRADEYKSRVVDVRKLVTSSVAQIARDLEQRPPVAESMTFVSSDCRMVPDEFLGAFEIAITSPPYLNGTNYFRNTKIELWLLGFIAGEQELGRFRNEAIAAGINNVSRSRPAHRPYESVEDVAAKLDACAGDRRIPTLVRHYFSDMSAVMESVHRVLEPGGRFVFDIGDSKFYGVHVPTDQLLEDIAREVGFTVESSRVLARRYSRDKSELVQRELVFRKDGNK